MGRADQGIRLSTGRYLVIPRVLCFLTHGDDVLLLRGAPDKRIWANRYNGVGGHVERGEDVYSAARREIAEETALHIDELHLCGVVNIAPDADGVGVLMFVFAARAPSRAVQPSPEGTLAWFHPDQLDELDLVEDLPLLLPRVLAHSPASPPFFAHTTYDDNDRLILTFHTDRHQ